MRYREGREEEGSAQPKDASTIMLTKINQGSLDAVGRFYSGRAGYPLHELEPGAFVVVDSTDMNESRSTHHARVVWMWVMEDRAILASRPDHAPLLREVARGVAAPSDLMRPEMVRELTTRCSTLARSSRSLRPYLGRKYYCDAMMHRPVHDESVHKLTRENAPPAMRELRCVGIPDDLSYLLAEDAAYAYFLGDSPVAFAGTHPARTMANCVGDVMAGTLAEHRRRGCGKAVISATTGEVVSRGRVAVWGMSHDNVPAMKTASAVGYQQYCEVFELRSEA